MREKSASYSLPGRRSTTQRRLLLDLILHTEGHLGADELYRRAREQDLAISLSTVYRNLKLFKELGLVEERHFAEEHHHYEAKATAQHHHLVCLGCGKVIEFASPLAEQMRRRVGAENNFVISDIEIRMKGYCDHCQQKMAKG